MNRLAIFRKAAILLAEAVKSSQNSQTTYEPELVSTLSYFKIHFVQNYTIATVR